MTRATSPLRAAVVLAATGALATALMVVVPAGAASAAPVAIDLYAGTGTTTFPGSATPVTVWGYTTAGAAPTGPGGPTITVDEGDAVTITLHNGLPAATSLLVQGQGTPPDRTGVAPGATKSYTFTASRPGTYLYEAGLVPGAQYQVPMGLYGALVVRPAATGQAYADPATAFDEEQVLVLSEIDPTLNNSAARATYDLRKFAPRYFLVNGKAYPDTAPIPTSAGGRLLLRYVNAGLQYHSMELDGAYQTVIALDGSPLDLPRRYAADTFGPGQTTDVLVTPSTTAADRRLALHDGNLLLHNSNAAGLGGMLAFVDVAGTGTTGDTAGPVASAVALAGDALTATVSDATTGGSAVTGATAWVDSLAGAGTPMAAGDGAFDSATEAVSLVVALPSGHHVVYVRGQDAAGNPGVLSSVLVVGGDTTGPVTTGVTLAPHATNGSVAVAVSATADDTASGGHVAAAEMFVDTAGNDGEGIPLAVGSDAAVSAVSGSLPAATVAALSEGTHAVHVHARDAGGAWGAVVSADLVVDKTGPTASGSSVSPSPNNGTLSYSSSTPSVRVSSTLADAGAASSGVVAAEVFLDAVGANGTGIAMAAVDGTLSGPSEAAYAEIPLATVALLADGPHTLTVHARDGAGNWGPTATTTLVVDKTKPVLSGLAATPNPTAGAGTVTLSVTVTDTSALSRVEWFRGTDPGAGNATPMTVTGSGPYSATTTIDTSTWPEGTTPLVVRARDGAGNWSATSSTNLVVTAPLTFSTFGNSNPPTVTGTADDADVYAWSGSAFSRAFDASTHGVPVGANVDGLDRVDATHLYLSFADTVSITGLGTVEDEDVVYYADGVWSLWFDGSARGLTSANLDLDAISVVGGTLYFSTLGNTNPPGVAGTADDADIYSWNGTGFARVLDATAVGIPAAANVDGFVRVDGTHDYFSFAADTTVTGLGAVQDEDVVHRSGTSWNTYFDGTAHNLTSANLDIDAFDIP
ncbi:multicopper oxidase domain-containing protein [Xylanimonas sp. McL0601]|uniref:multicopper oxidase domain-containing protein n=1 Tax=Xylanimonas sp. McL0601 TaxID=3414739 RepID=UPI003CF95778